MSYELICADSRDALKTISDNSVDAIVTDPPYSLGFLGAKWDSPQDNVANDVGLWRECLRVLKPGGHLVSFGGTRTYHRMTCAIEDAGFEIRDCLMWLYGSGFPKSFDVAKAIDKQNGHHRGKRGEIISQSGSMEAPNYERTDKGEPITDAAKAWNGWGTALKPACEPITLARKPFTGTVADNVLAHGTGALNIDASRIVSDAQTRASHNLGRFPSNVLLDEEAATLLDAQTPRTKSTPSTTTNRGSIWGSKDTGTRCIPYDDEGGASRFFYCAKASKSERERGLKSLDVGKRKCYNGTDNGTIGGEREARNTHPTVKPIALMRWLCRLVTPDGGLILDPFCGSGSTGIAAVGSGYGFIGIDQSAEYLAIADARISA